MNTHTTLPASRMQKVLQFPLTRLITGFLMVFLPVAIWQTISTSLPITPLLRSILVTAFTVPVAFGAYYVLVHFIERRELTELNLSGAARETAQGIAIGALFSGVIMAILALTKSLERIA